MTVIEFIKKYGWEHSKDVSNGWITNYENIVLNELKSYIEAYELVQSYGGLNLAKQELLNNAFNPILDVFICLKEAIELVEEIE